MSDRFAAIEAYQNALVKGDEDAAAWSLADYVVVETTWTRWRAGVLGAGS